MPFLRAALLKKKLQPETERVKVELPPVIEEQPEPEEEFTPTQIEDLHRLIDIRTEEAERAEEEIPLEPVIVVVPETEIVPEISESELQPDTSEFETEPEILETELQPDTSESEMLPEIEIEPEILETETPQETSETETEPEISETELQQETSESEMLPEIEIEPEISETELQQETSETEIEPEILETETPQDTTPEITESEPEIEPEISPEPETESTQEESQPASSQKDYSGSQLNYDFTSGERYVDKVSTKTEFDKMLDELSAISKELLSWQADKFARDYTVKFSEGESSVAEARKYEAFLGGYITNAAMMLYDKGYRDAAIKQLEQAISILQARKKLEDETSAIKSRVEEQNDAVDLSDILGLFGDG